MPLEVIVVLEHITEIFRFCLRYQNFFQRFLAEYFQWLLLVVLLLLLNKVRSHALIKLVFL